MFLMVETFGQFGLDLVTRFNQRGEPKFSNVYQKDHQQSLCKENKSQHVDYIRSDQLKIDPSPNPLALMFVFVFELL